jgi:YbbR domain-containing protein
MATESKWKRLFTHDWEAKLICLVLAMLLWWVVSKEINRSSAPLQKPEMPEGWPFQTVPTPVSPPTPLLPRIGQ